MSHSLLKLVFKDRNVILKKQNHPPMWYLWVRSAANVLPVTDDGKILIMHEYKKRDKKGMWIWGFPGGIIEPGETAAKAAKRECEEELGLSVGRIEKIVEVKTYFPETSVTYFLGFNLGKGKSKGWEKIGKVKEVTVEELMQLALDAKIQDPRMVVAVLALYKKVKSGKIKL